MNKENCALKLVDEIILQKIQVFSPFNYTVQSNTTAVVIRTFLSYKIRYRFKPMRLLSGDAVIRKKMYIPLYFL